MYYFVRRKHIQSFDLMYLNKIPFNYYNPFATSQIEQKINIIHVFMKFIKWLHLSLLRLDSNSLNPAYTHLVE